MLTGFKNAVEVDFTLEENKKKIEKKLRQKRRSLLYHRLQRKYSDMHAHAAKNRLMRQSRHLTKHSKNGA